MSTFTKTLKTAVVVAGVALASQASAHGKVSETIHLPPIAAKTTHEVTIKCPWGHYAMSGGYDTVDQPRVAGGLVVTASYPVNTRTWGVEISNMSGRITGAQEASITIHAYCGYRH